MQKSRAINAKSLEGRLKMNDKRRLKFARTFDVDGDIDEIEAGGN